MSAFCAKPSNFVFVLASALLFGFSSHAYANSNEFESALALLKKQSYTQAYTAFSKLVDNDYSSIDYSFYLAQSATKLHKNQEAITAYERILILQPNNTRAKLELGKIYYNQSDYTLAKTYFDDANKDEIPNTVRTNINQFLDQIALKTQTSKLTGAIILGVGHDSNVNVSPEASSWFVPVFGQEFESASDPVASLYTEQAATLTHLYKGTSKYGFDIKNNLTLYNKSIPGESEYNIFYFRYQPSLIFVKDNYTIETALQYDTMRYGGDAYLETYGFVPKISHEIDHKSLVSAQMKLLVKNYLRNADQQRDSRYNEFELKYFRNIMPNTTWVSAINFAQEREDKNSTLDVSNDVWGIKTGLYHMFSPNLQVSTEVQYSKKSYLDNNLFFLNKREDDAIGASLNLSKSINKDIAVQLRAEHIVNNSNQKAYTYNKNVFLVNLVNRF